MKKILSILIIGFAFTSCSNNECSQLANHQIGEYFQGGVIIHIYQEGENGYVKGQQHGIISSTFDQTFNSTSTYYSGETGCMWQPGTYSSTAQTTYFNLTNATGKLLGTGGQNTNLILTTAQQTNLPFPAATLARNYNGGGYKDWSLPSKDELYKQFQHKDIIGGFSNNWYWSSTEKNIHYVEALNFSTGNFDGIGGYKGPGGTPYKVRAIRYF
jgi:hypothetical protein